MEHVINNLLQDFERGKMSRRQLIQSLAIIVYLDQLYPDPPLVPRDPVDGAHVRAMKAAYSSMKTFPGGRKSNSPG